MGNCMGTSRTNTSEGNAQKNTLPKGHNSGSSHSNSDPPHDNGSPAKDPPPNSAMLPE